MVEKGCGAGIELLDLLVLVVLGVGGVGSLANGGSTFMQLISSKYMTFTPYIILKRTMSQNSYVRKKYE